MERRSVNLLGIKIDTFDIESALEFAINICGQIVTINPEMIENKDFQFKKILNEAQLVIPDGIGVKIALRLKGVKANRIAGIEFAHRLMQKMPQSVALIGAKPTVIAKAAENLKTEIPNLNIVYAQDGYFDSVEQVYEELTRIQPRLILVALGSPKQEEFIYGLKKLLPNSLMIGVGGSFDVWAGEVERAPVFYQKMGLEWLYRTVKQPQRFKRIFPTLPIFIFRALIEKKDV